MEERLQKIIAAAGLCSRRTAEKWITEGRVLVNQRTALLGACADPQRDFITVDGHALPQREKYIYLLLNKPRGYVTTLSDEKGRPTVADLVQDVGSRVFPVGRLDLQSEGLLLMTNDGEFMQHLTHPKYEISKTYWVKVAGNVQNATVRLAKVAELDGETIRPAQTKLLREGAHAAELYITIHEGKNRQIRRMCAVCNLQVLRLKRVREHTLHLGDLPSGKWRYLTEQEISELKEKANCNC